MNFFFPPSDSNHPQPEDTADGNINGETFPATDPLAYGAEYGDDNTENQGKYPHEHAAGQVIRTLPIGVLNFDADCRPTGHGISNRAAECHQVEEIIDEGGGIHHQQENDADPQEEKVGENGLLVLIAISKRFGQEVLHAHGIDHTDSGKPEAQ